jgi:hypothetical protein
MTDATLLPFDLPSFRRKKLTVDFSGGNQSSNGGLLSLRSAERKLGVCGRLADAMPDRRDASRICHAMFEMVMARVCAIACGHEDAIDLDRLRHDPLMKVAVGRGPQSGAPLASQSTIRRLENAPRKTEAARLTAALIDQFGTASTEFPLAVRVISELDVGVAVLGLPRHQPGFRIRDRASARQRERQIAVGEARNDRRWVGLDAELLEDLTDAEAAALQRVVVRDWRTRVLLSIMIEQLRGTRRQRLMTVTHSSSPAQSTPSSSQCRPW